MITTSKDDAYKAQCASNLKQLITSVQIYRASRDLEGVYGDQVQMGLPATPTIVGHKDGKVVFSTPWAPGLGTCMASLTPHAGGFEYQYGVLPAEFDTVGYFKARSEKQRENTIIFLDFNHNPPDVPILQSGINKRIAFVRLSGQYQVVHSIYGYGNVAELEELQF
ncbi:MAG: hypothetical protein JSS72_04485 [Armatimonadetes bacterium]|nr:hypothetical protein [Armatimonadota bacterium]